MPETKAVLTESSSSDAAAPSLLDMALDKFTDVLISIAFPKHCVARLPGSAKCLVTCLSGKRL